ATDRVALQDVERAALADRETGHAALLPRRALGGVGPVDGGELQHREALAELRARARGEDRLLGGGRLRRALGDRDLRLGAERAGHRDAGGAGLGRLRVLLAGRGRGEGVDDVDDEDDRVGALDAGVTVAGGAVALVRRDR